MRLQCTAGKKDFELARLHYYIEKQQKFITLQSFLMAALKSYLYNENELLIELTTGTQRIYNFGARFSLTVNDAELCRLIEEKVEQEQVSLSYILKDALLSVIAFTDQNDTKISNKLYNKRAYKRKASTQQPVQPIKESVAEQPTQPTKESVAETNATSYTSDKHPILSLGFAMY